MSNYIPWYGKKSARFARLRLRLAALIRSSAPAVKIAEAAEAVRAAKLRALEAERWSAKRVLGREALDHEFHRWLELPTAAIIESCRGRKPPPPPLPPS